MSPSRRRAIGAVRGLASRSRRRAHLPCAPLHRPRPIVRTAHYTRSLPVRRDGRSPGLPARALPPLRPRWRTVAREILTHRAPRHAPWRLATAVRGFASPAPPPRPSRAVAALRLWGAINGALAARPIPPSPQAAWQVAHAESFAGGVSVRPLPPAGAPGPRRARRLFPPTTLFSPRANAPAAQESLDSNGTSALQFARFMHWNQSHVPKKIMESTNLYSIIVEHL